MKILLLAPVNQDSDQLSHLIHYHFPSVSVCLCQTLSEAMDKVSSEDSLGVILFDCGLTKDKTMKAAEDMVDLLGEKSLLFWGDELEIKIAVNQEFFNAHTTSDLLKKPLDSFDIKNKIQKCLARFKQEQFEQSIITINRSELVPSKIKNFFLYSKVPFDACYEVSDTKFAIVLQKDVPYSPSTIEDLIRRKIKVLYLKKNDQLQLLESSLELLTTFFAEVQNKELDHILKNQIQAVSLIHQYLRTIGITESIVSLTRDVISSASSSFFKFKGLKDFLNTFPSQTRDSTEQSVMTIYLCIFILAKMGWNSQTSREKMALASILHDATLSNDDMCKIYSLKDPNLKMFTEQEQDEFYHHPLKAADIAKHFGGFTEVDFVIAQHHELPTQDGFPNALNSHEITTYSGIFILSNNFVSLVNQRGISQEALTKSFEIMTNDYNIGNFKAPLQLLGKMIKEKV